MAPLHAAQRWAWSPAAPTQPAWYGFWSLVIWLIGLAFMASVALDNLPEIREFLRRLPELFREFADAFRHLAAR